MFRNIYRLSKPFFIVIFFLNLLNSELRSDFDKSSEVYKNKKLNEYEKVFLGEFNFSKDPFSNLAWEDLEPNKDYDQIIWEKINSEEKNFIDQKNLLKNISYNSSKYSISTLNRSIIFNDNVVGPDVSWIVPPGFGWNKKYKFDLTARGHNTRIPDPVNKTFFGWNDGDAVGLISYQFLDYEKSSFGINFGVRSLYQGNQAAGGSSSIGEGTSAGFRWDYRLSESSGIAFGAEQLVHFDGSTDTGRNLYLTASKAFWSEEYNGHMMFPLQIATAGIATGRMAVGTVRGFCSEFLGGSGTDLENYPRLCWSPVFSLARLWNERLSTYFEYNSRFFLLGTSYAPIRNIPLRGNFGLILSDHVDNYKIHDGSEMNWVFNISLGI